jgi:hypothetical protein
MSTDTRRRTTPPAIRFWAKVTEQGDCWVWKGAILRNGYGYFGVSKGRCIVAHRSPNGTRKCRECYRKADRERKRAKRGGIVNVH